MADTASFCMTSQVSQKKRERARCSCNDGRIPCRAGRSGIAQTKAVIWIDGS